MKYVLAIIVMLLFTGCPNRDAMSAKDMRIAIDECEKHGFISAFVKYPFSNNPNSIAAVQCHPKGLR